MSSKSELEMEDVAKSELVDGFANLLSTGKGSDIVVTCHGMTFNLHKAILASRSKFFETACWGDFAEGQSHRIDLPDDDEGVVKKMIDYFYLLDYESDKDTGLRIAETEAVAAADFTIEDDETREHVMRLHDCFPQYDMRDCFDTLTRRDLNYNEAYNTLCRRNMEMLHPTFFPSLENFHVRTPIKKPDPHQPVPELAIHASIYGIADKYAIQGLKSISTQKLKAALLHEAWIPASQEFYSSNMIDELALTIQVAWDSTPESDRGLRAPLLDHAWKIRKVLLQAERFKHVVEEMPQFAQGLLFRTLGRLHADE